MSLMLSPRLDAACTLLGALMMAADQRMMRGCAGVVPSAGFRSQGIVSSDTTVGRVQCTADRAYYIQHAPGPSRLESMTTYTFHLCGSPVMHGDLCRMIADKN